MSVSAAAIRKMVELGLAASDIADLCDMIETGEAAKTVRQAQNARAYERRKLLKPAEFSSAENLLKPAENLLNSAPLARREDNLLTTEGPCRTDDDDFAQARASAWTGEQLAALGDQIRQAAGDTIDLTSPAIHSLAPITRLLRGGDGPPCELEADVLPAIRVVAARTRPKAARSWAYFRQAITEARDERLAGAPAVVVVDFTARSQGPPPNSYAAHEAQQAAIRAEVRKRFQDQ